MTTLLLILPVVGSAEELSSGDAAPGVKSPEIGADETHPILSADGTWAGNTVILVAGLFLAAVVIGPIVHAEMPGEVPVAFSHHEDPGHHSEG